MSHIGYIYAVGNQKVVKIGWSRTPHRRTEAIRTHAPVNCTLLGYREGSKEEELAVHKRLSEYRVHGEWFVHRDEVREFVSSIASVVEVKRARGPVYKVAEPLRLKEKRKKVGTNAQKAIPVASDRAPITDQIEAIETRLYGARVSVLALLREANVNKAQWSRWKFHGQRPLVETWERVLEAADRLAPQPAGRRRG